MQSKLSSSKIESQKVNIQQVFKEFWFRVPEYQRSFVWQSENIVELLEDLTYASEHSPFSEYFLGSLVLQKRANLGQVNGSSITYNEYDVLDGQQRLTTIFLILAVIRDIAVKDSLSKTCDSFIFQEEDEFQQIPERLRLVYNIRDKVEEFIHRFVKQRKGTTLTKEISDYTIIKNVSVSNLAKGILSIHDYFLKLEVSAIERFAKHLFNNVIVIYVASEQLEDAFRLFTILNSRGVPLTNADILKSLNLGEVSEGKSMKYAEQWEELESSMGAEDFNRLLSFIRTIYVKEKARENIVKEFEDKIYKATPPLLKRGQETFETISIYGDIYKKVVLLEDLPPNVPLSFHNTIIIMVQGLPSNDWIPPLLAFYKKFQYNGLHAFTTHLANKFSADWICSLSPSSRINNMAIVLRLIEKSETIEEVFADRTAFQVSLVEIEANISNQLYRKRFCKYILLLLEYLMHDNNTVFAGFTKLSIEHILPQNPSEKSQWVELFTEEDRKNMTHNLGNLVLLSRSKNSSLGRKDFSEKKELYFSASVSVFPNSVRVMKHEIWNPALLQDRHKILINKVLEHYRIKNG
jgi:uncharacterized protein with ParB-like and HNH nuclease domain